MTIPIGSADAERAFSVMNSVKRDRRGLLSEKYLEDLLRIRLNGPKKLERFPAKKYTKLWLQRGHMKTDDSTSKKKTQLSLSNDNDESTNIP